MSRVVKEVAPKCLMQPNAIVPGWHEMRLMMGCSILVFAPPVFIVARCARCARRNQAMYGSSRRPPPPKLRDFVLACAADRSRAILTDLERLAYHGGARPAPDLQWRA
jgi:hypothetical protein